MKIRPILSVIMLMSVMALTACNTVAGAGEDVSAIGHATTGGANQVHYGTVPYRY
jgi:predicted small secreted protein